MQSIDMKTVPVIRAFRVVVISPENFPHSAAFAEMAETLLYGLQSLGHEASLAYNSFEHGATNIVIGAHLLSSSQVLPENVIIYNTEQADTSSVWLKKEYLDLIRRFETWDYSRRNIELLSGKGSLMRLVPIGYMPQLSRIAKREEDIDVLFYGSMNERRRRIIQGLLDRGLNVVAVFNVYGEERDDLISRAKVVLNVHFYEAKIFEIVRVSYLLANRKAVVAEIEENTDIDPAYREAVAGVPYDDLVDACVDLVTDHARRKSLEERGFAIMSARREEDCLRDAVESLKETRLPRKINLGSGKSFKTDCLNIDINSFWKPDVVADLSQPGELDRMYDSERFGGLELRSGYFSRIEAIDVLEHVHALPTLMTHCLELLCDGGEMHVLVPYDLSYGAWQDPTHVRAFNERSWLYYTEWFWYLGWRHARFDLVENLFELSSIGQKMHADGVPVASILLQPRAVDSMRVTLRKRFLTEAEQSFVERFLVRDVTAAERLSLSAAGREQSGRDGEP